MISSDGYRDSVITPVHLTPPQGPFGPGIGDASLAKSRIASACWRADNAGTASFSVLAVLLLVLFAYSMALTGTGPGGDGAGGVSLEGAEAELGMFLREALDASLERALPMASIREDVCLDEALDASLVRYTASRLPSTAGGWVVDLVDVTGGLGAGPLDVDGNGTPVSVRTPTARLVVDLVDPSREAVAAAAAPPVRLGIEVMGGDLEGGSWDPGLANVHGPVAYWVQRILWAEVQARALSPRGYTDALLTERDVMEALNVTVRAMASGRSVRPGPPSLDLTHLVRQSVEGAVERNLGWIVGYLPALDGLALPAGGLRGVVARELALAVLSVLEDLEGTSGVGLPVIEGADLAGAVSEGLLVLDELEMALSTQAVVASVGAMVETHIPGLPAVFVGPLVNALSDVGVSVGRLGLACARDALLVIGQTGRHVDGAEDLVWGETAGYGVLLEGLTVSTRWSGEKACEPPGLLSGGGWGETGIGTLPYTSVCRVAVTGEAVIDVSTVGATGRPVHASWRAPVDLEWEVAVVTGRPLDGVRYEPSATLTGDLARVADAVWARASESVGWVTARFRDAVEMVGTWAEDLYGNMRDSVMTKSAYTLSQALWRIGGSLMDRRTGLAINGTWDLLMDLFGDDLREALTWEMQVMGWDVVVSVDPAKQQLVVGLAWEGISLNVSARRLCDPHPPFEARPIEGYHWGVFGEARLDRGEREAVLYLDPLTLERDSVLTLEVSWGDGDGGGDGGVLVVEALEARKLSRGWSVSLSDVSGAGWLLSVAGGGMVDAGLAVHGELMDEGAARDALERAVKDAWMATMRGWKVGDLVGRTGQGPDADTFVQTLMRELDASLTEQGTKLVSEVELFLEIRFPTPGWPDLRLSLVVSEPLEALLPLASWVKRSLEPMVGSALSGSVEGATDAMEAWLAEHVLVRFELSWAVEVPLWLTSGSVIEMPDQLGLVVRGQANVAALVGVAGGSLGRWEASVEVLLRGVPGAVLAVVPGMGSTGWGWAEVTLLRATLREIEVARLLLSQVLYDARGRDADLEYVELLNAGGRMLDLGGFTLRDADGGFVLRGHLPVLPGDRFLVVRNASAVRGEWDVLPDVGRMGLRLANDGDVVRLLDPEGRLLDLVAWEGHMEGWGSLEAEEGLALVRIEGDGRTCQCLAWDVGPPSPRRSGW